MLLEDSLPVQPTMTSLAPSSELLTHGSSPYSLPGGLPPATMHCHPPPVTRLVPRQMIAATSVALPGSVIPVDSMSLICKSETETDGVFASSSDKRKPFSPLQNISDTTSRGHAGLLSSASNVGTSSPLATSSPRGTNGDCPSLPSNSRNKIPYHVPLSIKIPVKIPYPPRKDGTRPRQSAYKEHEPGNGLLKLAKPEVSASRLPVELQEGHFLPNRLPPQQLPTGGGSSGFSTGVCGPIIDGMQNINVNTKATVKTHVEHNTSQLTSATNIQQFLPPDSHHSVSCMTSSNPVQTNSSTGENKKRRKGKGGAISSKRRTVFTKEQIYSMEKRFERQKYLTSVERIELAKALGLEDNVVKIWFQNRRSKMKKRLEVSSTVTDIEGRRKMGEHSLTTMTSRLTDSAPIPMTSSASPPPHADYLYQESSVISQRTDGGVVTNQAATLADDSKSFRPHMNVTATSCQPLPITFANSSSSYVSSSVPTSSMVIPSTMSNPLHHAVPPATDYHPSFAASTNNVMSAPAMAYNQPFVPYAPAIGTSVPLVPAFGHGQDFAIKHGGGCQQLSSSRSGSPFGEQYPGYMSGPGPRADECWTNSMIQVPVVSNAYFPL